MLAKHSMYSHYDYSCIHVYAYSYIHIFRYSHIHVFTHSHIHTPFSIVYPYSNPYPDLGWFWHNQRISLRQVYIFDMIWWTWFHTVCAPFVIVEPYLYVPITMPLTIHHYCLDQGLSNSVLGLIFWWSICPRSIIIAWKMDQGLSISVPGPSLLLTEWTNDYWNGLGTITNIPCLYFLPSICPRSIIIA